MRSATNRMAFNHAAVQKLIPSADGRAAYYDGKVRDLGLRVEPSGRKTFFWFRKILGKPTFKSLGEFPTVSIQEARGRAQELSAKLERFKANGYEGPNPFERERGEPTLGELFEDYVSRHLRQFAKRPQSAEREARYVFKHLSAWNDRKLSHITRRDVLDRHAEIGKKHRTMSNRVLQLLRAMFGHAQRIEAWTGENPASRVRLFHEKGRERFLSPDEVGRLFQALKDEPSPEVRDFVLLALMTGARKADVLSMRWQDMTLSNGDAVWRVPDPKGEPYKVVLVPKAVEILEERLSRRKEGCPWVFPGRRGHLTDLKKRWHGLLRRAKIADFHIHDLRRSLGSWQAAQGTSLLMIGKSLGHKSLKATQIYARLDVSSVRASVESAVSAMIAAGEKEPKALEAGKA